MKALIGIPSRFETHKSSRLRWNRKKSNSFGKNVFILMRAPRSSLLQLPQQQCDATTFSLALACIRMINAGSDYDDDDDVDDDDSDDDDDDDPDNHEDDDSYHGDDVRV